ncbi:hypothetical protein AB833_20585 [Chromatiales bacterium (ex Bugula neritina AB1)]|nr:hypothetical protein AB833_20585 [Chromatiales bacterium (ex Bugula neritina AB1)]
MINMMQRALGIRKQLEPVAGNPVLLTFDDGPDPIVTGKVLNLLDEYNAKAVFFVVGDRIGKAPYMLTEVLQRGHIIGNHSHCHWLDKPPGLTEYLADLKQCQSRIYDVCGYTPTLYRPPLGAITVAAILAARRLNFELCKWSLDTNDWRMRDDHSAHNRGLEAAGEIQPCDILLMHDNNRHTPVLLQAMLSKMQESDFDLTSFVNSRLTQQYNSVHPVQVAVRE